MQKLIAGLCLVMLGGVIAVANEDAEFQKLVKASNPVVPAPKSVKVGPLTLEAKVVKTADDKFITGNVMRTLGDVVSRGGKLYLSGPKTKGLYGYVIKDGALTRNPAFGEGGKVTLEREIEKLFIKDDTTVIAAVWADAYMISGSEVMGGLSIEDEAGLSPDGTWALDPEFYNEELKQMDVVRIDIEEGRGMRSEWIGKENKAPWFNLHSADTTCITDEMILIGGQNTDHDKQVFAMTHDRKHLFTVGDKEISDKHCIGWVRSIQVAGPYVLVTDSNLRTLHVFNKKGESVGKAKLNDLLGLDYPWISGASYNKEQKVLYVAAANDREKVDVADGFLFEIRGFE